MNAFDRMAGGFDTGRRIRRAYRIADMIRERIEPTYASAMEYGCGTGLIGMELIDAFDRIEFLDSSPSMIEEMRKKLGPYKNASARALDLTTRSAEGRAYDFIFSSMALHHIKDAGGILETLAGMLTPGGKLAIVDLMPVSPRFHIEEEDFDGHHGFELPAFRTMMARAGLGRLESEVIYEGSKPVRGGDVPYALFLCAGTLVR